MVTTSGITAESSIVIRKDSEVPTVTVSSTPSTQTALTTAQFTFSSNDSLSGVDRVECSLDQAAFAACTSPHSLTGLASGSHNMRIQARDRAGNISAIYNYTWLIDTNVPTVVIASGPVMATNSQRILVIRYIIYNIPSFLTKNMLP